MHNRSHTAILDKIIITSNIKYVMLHTTRATLLYYNVRFRLYLLSYFYCTEYILMFRFEGVSEISLSLALLYGKPLWSYLYY